MENFLKLLGGNGNGNAKEIVDNTFINEIKNTNLLADLSKSTYLKNLSKVTDIFFGKKVSIFWVIHHPDEFKIACEKYGKEKDLQPASLASYIIPIMFCINYHREIQENDPKLKYRWTKLRDEIRLPDDSFDNESQPTTRQKKAYMPFEEVCKIRDSLPNGSYGRLLLSLYTMIEPVRSDFDEVRIYDEKPKKEEGNYIVLGNEKKLYLNEYKTSERYGELVTDLPDDLIKQIKSSLKNYPREFLFVDRSGNNYSPKSFNKWANKMLKKILDNNFMTLTMLRHIYLSQPKLDLDNKTIGEKRQIASKMLHSVAVQKKYRLNIDDK